MKCGLLSNLAIIKVIFLSFCISNPAGIGAATQGSQVRALGCFQNVQSDDHHASGSALRASPDKSGFTVRLWTSTVGMIGLVDYHRGLPGDPPMGVLTDIRFNPETRSISFRAKLTDGLHSCIEHNNIPSRTLLSFQGVLDDDVLKGDLILTDQLHASRVVAKYEDYELHKDNDCRLDNYNDVDVWWWYWEPVYQARGPKW